MTVVKLLQIRAAVAAFALFALPAAARAAIAMTGPDVSELASVDRSITALMTRWDVPGGSVAISYHGRLVYARGYGIADKEHSTLVFPWSQFRIASVSKPITSVAILHLQEQGKLNIDDRVVDYLRDLLPAGGVADKRIEKITIRELMEHAGGWDAEGTGVDIQFSAHDIARAFGVSSPPSPDHIARYALSQPLQAAPGTHFAYANVGYTLLGRIVERVTGRSYEDYVKAEVLAPMTIGCMRIGSNLEKDAVPGEVRYYDMPSAPRSPSVYDESATVSQPYAGFDMRGLDAAGGWIASVVDLMKFLSAVDGGATRPDFLKPETMQTMTERPPLWATSTAYYALGWSVQRSGGAAAWWHTGGLPGSAAYLVRLAGEINLVALFNTLPANSEFYSELDKALGEGLSGVTAWPEHDLFSVLPGCVLPRQRGVR
jgi:N-acyl-D-amino-acid deacylase